MPTRTKQVVVVRRDLRLRRAEAAAYVARASIQFFAALATPGDNQIMSIGLSEEEQEWFDGEGTVIVLGVQSEGALQAIITRSEIQGLTVHTLSKNRSDDDKSEETSTLVCVAIGPHDEDSIDAITAKLKLF